MMAARGRSARGKSKLPLACGIVSVSLLLLWLLAGGEEGGEELVAWSFRGDAPYELRGAFDVGSGSTKLTVAWVDTGRSVIMEEVHSAQMDVLVGVDLRRSEDNRLSEEILEELIRVSERLMADGEKAVLNSRLKDCSVGGCSVRYRGVATAAFRMADNGQEWLQKLANAISVPLTRISQEEEGKLGYYTARALAASRPGPPRPLIAWDSGGASFQLTAPEGMSLHGVRGGDEFNVFQGDLGSSSVAKWMVEDVQGGSFGRRMSSNPATLHDCYQLLEKVTMNATVGSTHPWLREAVATVAVGQADLVGFGGDTSMFQTAIFAVHNLMYLRHGKGELQTAEQLLARPDVHSVTKAQVWDALTSVVDRTDAELRQMGFDPPEFLIPKLVLMCGVLDALGLPSVLVFAANGSTAGILATAKYWR